MKICKKIMLLILVVISLSLITNSKEIASVEYKTYLISCRDEYTCEPDMGTYSEEDDEIGPPIVDYGDGNGPVTPETDPYLNDTKEDETEEDTTEKEDEEDKDEVVDIVEEDKVEDKETEPKVEKENNNLSTTVDVPNTGVDASIVGNVIGVIFIAMAYFMISYIIKKENNRKKD